MSFPNLYAEALSKFHFREVTDKDTNLLPDSLLASSNDMLISFHRKGCLLVKFKNMEVTLYYVMGSFTFECSGMSLDTCLDKVQMVYRWLCNNSSEEFTNIFDSPFAGDSWTCQEMTTLQKAKEAYTYMMSL